MTRLDHQAVLSQVLEQARSLPDRRAIVSGGRSVTYQQLAEAIRTRAGTLADDFGVTEGDRVLLMAAAHTEFVCTYFAVHALGAICVPIDPASAPRRLSLVMDRVIPKLVVAESSRKQHQSEHVTFEQLASADHASPAIEPRRPARGDTADILFTTGTSGNPKGVVLSHGAISAACVHINAFIGTRGDAVEVLPLPLSHSFGLGRMRCILTLGATLVLLPGIVSAAGVFSALRDSRATGFASVPAGLAILQNDTGPTWERLAEQLDYIEIGSSTMPLEQKKDLMRRLPRTRICMHYGLTEASRSAYLSFHDDAANLESIGRPSPGVEMRIVDELGREREEGIQGRIQVRGKHVMSEYWQDPALTNKTLVRGWLDTGDLGHRTANGYYYLTARHGDIINVGGRKVAPQEIEAVLASHPAIAECACVGIPDPQGFSGEMISAFLVAKPGSGEQPKFSQLARLLRQNLESYKVPRRFTWVDSLPKSSSGKLLRRKLREGNPSKS